MSNIDLNWNEEETRAELIDPHLKNCGWDSAADDVKIYREYCLTKGRILSANTRGVPLKADYVLEYKNKKIAVIEAKKVSLPYTEGVGQAKDYATRLKIRFAYSTNGQEIYQIDTLTGSESTISDYPSPEQLLQMLKRVEDTKQINQAMIETFNAIAYESQSGKFEPRYYQENAINAVLNAISQGKNRILLTLATGTGKTAIAFQIAWKLFKSRWNIKEFGQRQPRILFLADRNILADQAYNAFGAFPEDALVRISPREIRKKGSVPMTGSVFFTIFQTFMSGPDDTPYFGDYPPDYFDFIIIDECHRGGAKDEGRWRAIMEYFSPAIQLGLTATPKRKINADTYAYFGEPVYTYSLKDGINDGFLTPFKIRSINTNYKSYQFDPDDDIEGDIDREKTYKNIDFNRNIQIKEREIIRVKQFLSEINLYDKTLVFCANQAHALFIRDLINQFKKVKDINYCVRVTADEGEIGEKFLRQFQDNERSIPTILTTSQKLSTGVDAINIRNIVILRPINSVIEFKQIIGRGTRLCDRKAFFTVYDFEDASQNFQDPEWDGDPLPPTEPGESRRPLGPEGKTDPEGPSVPPTPPKPIIQVKLGGDRNVNIINNTTSFWDASGTPITAAKFLEKLYGALPAFFKDEAELRKIWQAPATRKVLLSRLASAGFDMDDFNKIKTIINAENSDIYDLLAFIAYSKPMLSRQQRVDINRLEIFSHFEASQQDFIEFVLKQYVNNGITELDDAKIATLTALKYGTPIEATQILGNPQQIRNIFCEFQHYLYNK